MHTVDVYMNSPMEKAKIKGFDEVFNLLNQNEVKNARHRSRTTAIRNSGPISRSSNEFKNGPPKPLNNLTFANSNSIDTIPEVEEE